MENTFNSDFISSSFGAKVLEHFVRRLFYSVFYLKNIFKFKNKSKNKCRHKNALLNAKEGYCPDCGEYLVKNYYLVRCKCCSVKRETKIVWGEIVPEKLYCKNCGSKEFYVEKLDSLNFIDAKYAVYLKETLNEAKCEHFDYQVWIEDEVEPSMPYCLPCRQKSQKSNIECNDM